MRSQLGPQPRKAYPDSAPPFCIQNGAFMFEKLGRFEIKGLLGRGAMGEVYLGIDPALGREVAIKTILATAAQGEDAEAALRPGGQGRRGAEPSKHRDHLRVRRGPRRPLHRHGAGAGPGSRRDAPAAQHHGRRGPGGAGPGLRRPRVRPPQQCHPPGHQALERQGPAGRPAHPGQGHGLRRGETQGLRDDRHGNRGGHRELHGAGVHPHGKARWPQRSLRRGGDALRVHLGPQALRGRHDSDHPLQDRERTPGSRGPLPAQGDQPRHPQRAGQGLGQGPGPALPDGG